MRFSAHILIIDDNKALLEAASALLKRHFSKVTISPNPQALPALLQGQTFDLILLDMNFQQGQDTGQEGLFWLEKIIQLSPQVPVVMITAFGDVSLAVDAMKRGATDFVLKPWDNENLIDLLKEVLNKTSQPDQQVGNQVKLDRLIGQSPAMQRVFSIIKQIAATDANVLILGENGTGKDLVAQALHRISHRSKAPFVSVDLGALSESLFESELFGHTKGAFTDARTERKGRFEMANKGTLFLDEIGNLSPAMQTKLLAVLQRRELTPIGSNRPISVDIRLLSATNQALEQMISQGNFRKDLYYRINTIELALPPLRERKGDITLLANHFLQSYNQQYQKAVHSIQPSALARLERYSWPGNVRELQHAIERAVIMANGESLGPEDFFLKNPNAHRETEKFKESLDELSLEEVEKLMIQKALNKHHGNITKAASELGLTRSSLYRRLEKYGM